MIKDFAMPSLGADMAHGTLVEWLKRPGDHVEKGDVVAVVETQKGAIEVEVFERGEVAALLVEPGATVKVGRPIAKLAVGEAAPAAPGPSRPVPKTGRPRASPAARRIARERGVELAPMAPGSGPEGAILSADVVAAAGSAAPSRRRPDLAAMRAAIARTMARAKREIPHYYVGHDVDVGEALDRLEARNAAAPPAERVLPAALFLHAVARAATAYPEFNGHVEDGAFRPSDAVHLGVAVSLRGGGLIAPAIRDAGELDLDALMARLRDLTRRARTGGLRDAELSAPTLTVSSLGDRGVDYLLPIIHPPQVAIVGIGRPTPRPRVVDGAVVPRTVVTLTLAADHRVSDGHRGALFLAEIAARLAGGAGA